MSEQGTQAQAHALGAAALDAVNAGLAAGQVKIGEAAVALMQALAKSPHAASQARALAGELASVVAGSSDVAPGRGDIRFADHAWQRNPFYRRLGQAYLATAQAITAAVDGADLDWR